MEKGTLKWYDAQKGYGFITPDVGDKDIYVHRTNVETLDRTLEKGDRVEFDRQAGAKGPEAKHVRLEVI